MNRALSLTLSMVAAGLSIGPMAPGVGPMGGFSPRPYPQRPNSVFTETDRRLLERAEEKRARKAASRLKETAR